MEKINYSSKIIFKGTINFYTLFIDYLSTVSGDRSCDSAKILFVNTLE